MGQMDTCCGGGGRDNAVKNAFTPVDVNLVSHNFAKKDVKIYIDHPSEKGIYVQSWIR